MSLTSAKAAKLLEKYGPNEIRQRPAHTPLDLFISQFKSPLVLMLFLATAVSFALGDTLEAVLILAIVVFNAILGFFQEYRAQRALEALKKITVSVVRVERDGYEREIDSKLLVPGDVIFLEEGSKVPADARLVTSMHLEVDEAALTGESLPVAKDLKENENLLFMGTTVVRGRARAEILHTGMGTKFGKIAAELSVITKEETPLEKKLAGTASQLGLLALGAGIVMSVIGITHGFTFISILLTAVSLAVAAVPEGLPAIITVTLAVGTQRMSRRKAILRKLTAIESLGGITVIATDKTGTLTKNEMRVTKVWTKEKQQLVETGVYCNNASLTPVEDHGSFDVVGDKTEGALLLYAQQEGSDYQKIKAKGTLVEEFAFDATTKTMSVVWKEGGETRVYAKGAPESILARSRLTQKEKDKIRAAFEEFAKEGLRTIAMATKKITWHGQKRERVEEDLIFLGFVGISDPARPEAASAIEQARKAGIATIMITGDNELTARAIARDIGLLKRGDEVVTGAQFALMHEAERISKLPHIRVFARTTPEQKLEIVRLLQNQGHVVAVTGDGVNDALALAQANVGVAMGITGTDVAKEAADMVVTDDNYATIVSAVEEGRIIYENMKSSIKYLVGCNIGEILSLVIGAIMGWPFILLPIQILYVNLVTDGLPALSLALNRKHYNIMARSPRTETELFTPHDRRWLVEVSLLTAASTIVAFWIGFSGGDLSLGRTLAFVVIAAAQQMIFLDVLGGDRSIFTHYVLKNKWAVVPVATVLAQVVLVYLVWFQGIFKTVSPPFTLLLLSLSVTVGMLVISEFRKRFLRHLFYH